MLAGCYSESTDVPLHLSTKATCAETGLLSERAADKRTMRDEGLRLGGTLAKPGLQIGCSTLTSFSVRLARVRLIHTQLRTRVRITPFQPWLPAAVSMPCCFS